jgi:hypothetical protein
MKHTVLAKSSTLMFLFPIRLVVIMLFSFITPIRVLTRVGTSSADPLTPIQGTKKIRYGGAVHGAHKPARAVLRGELNISLTAGKKK